jgi:predicted nucleic acid-binding protein
MTDGRTIDQLAARKAVAPPPFIVDNSVWGRLPTKPDVRRAFEALIGTHRPSSILVCPPVVAEYGFSARTADEHRAIANALTAFAECQIAPDSPLTLDVQFRVWRAGLVRGAGALDTVIAAYALANDATVVHYDRDFEIIARAVPDLKHRWIVPRGSVD